MGFVVSMHGVLTRFLQVDVLYDERLLVMDRRDAKIEVPLRRHDSVLVIYPGDEAQGLCRRTLRLHDDAIINPECSVVRLPVEGVGVLFLQQMAVESCFADAERPLTHRP